MLYIPKFINQSSDLNFGEAVTHENYNEKVNLNIEANDYQSMVLDLLLNEADPTLAYHIPYLDNIIDANNVLYEGRMDNLQDQIDTYDSRIEIAEDKADLANETMAAIIAGTTKAGASVQADKVAGVDGAGNYQYYGTGLNGNVGFHPVPETIWAEPMGAVTVDGVYFIPGLESVQEVHLSPELQEKLNREFIAYYDELQGLPSINEVELTGNKTLSDLGIQPVGNYLTSIPTEYVQRPELAVFDTITSVDAKITTERNARVDSISNLASTVNTNDTSVRSWATSRFNRCGVNAVPSNPIVGDMWVTV